MQFNSLNITSFRLDIEHVYPECGKSKLLKAVFSLSFSSAGKGYFLTGIFKTTSPGNPCPVDLIGLNIPHPSLFFPFLTVGQYDRCLDA